MEVGKGLLPKGDWELVNMSLQQAKTNLPRADYIDYQDANIGTRITRGHINYHNKQHQLAEIEKCILNNALKNNKNDILKYLDVHKIDGNN